MPIAFRRDERARVVQTQIGRRARELRCRARVPIERAVKRAHADQHPRDSGNDQSESDFVEREHSDQQTNRGDDEHRAARDQEDRRERAHER